MDVSEKGREQRKAESIVRNGFLKVTIAQDKRMINLKCILKIIICLTDT